MATPGLIQHVQHSGCQGNTITVYNVRLPNKSLSGNAILVGVNSGASGATISVTDDVGNTYALAKNNSDGNQVVSLFLATNCASGAQKIKVTFSVATGFTAALASEFNNISTAAPSSALDGTSGTAGSSTSIAAGNLTTTAPSSLVYQLAIQDSTSSAITSFTQGASPFKLLGADVMDSMASQYQVKSASGVINPSMTMSPTNAWNTVAIGVKSAAAGTALPAGIRVLRVLHNALPASDPFSRTLMFPCEGNLLALAWIGVASHNVTGMSDSNANVYTSGGPKFGNVDSGDIQVFYSKSPSATTTMTATVKTSGNDISGSTAIFYDIVGADTVAPFDSTATLRTASGTQSTTGTVSTVSITPSRANSLILTTMGVANNTLVDVTPGLFLSSSETPETSPWPNDQNNGWAVEYNPDVAQRTYTFSATGGTVGNWAAVAAAFMAPAPTGGAFPLLDRHLRTPEPHMLVRM